MNIDVKKLREEIKLVNEMRKNNCAKLNAALEAAHVKAPTWDFDRAARLTTAEERESFRKAHWERVDAYWAETRELKARFGAERATALYSLRAHSRGKLHIASQWVPQVNAPRIKMARTLEDQAKLIKSCVEQFEKPVEQVEAA